MFNCVRKLKHRVRLSRSFDPVDLPNVAALNFHCHLFEVQAVMPSGTSNNCVLVRVYKNNYTKVLTATLCVSHVIFLFLGSVFTAEGRKMC